MKKTYEERIKILTARKQKLQERIEATHAEITYLDQAITRLSAQASSTNNPSGRTIGALRGAIFAALEKHDSVRVVDAQRCILESGLIFGRARVNTEMWRMADEGVIRRIGCGHYQRL